MTRRFSTPKPATTMHPDPSPVRIRAFMESSTAGTFAGAVLVLCIAAACRHGAGTPPAQTPQPAATEADRAAIAKARSDSARYPYTEADVRFIARMIGHHSQAITMSRLAPTHGASDAVRRLAERIINAQQDEIVIMTQWLRDRGQPVPDTGAMMDHSQHAGHDAMMMMPGMLTPEQMQQLDAARGVEFDRLFLTFMIQHHRGAITMVEELIATPGAAQDQSVFKLASDVNVDQTTEVARMTTMLATILLQRPPS
jgi:uncharacterized protein (DUF305 family)